MDFLAGLFTGLLLWPFSIIGTLIGDVLVRLWHHIYINYLEMYIIIFPISYLKIFL